MDPTQSAGYSLKGMPMEGRVTLRRGENVLASSTGAIVMHETRLPPVIYFPRQDVFGLADRPNERQTFCPLKGTASYWDLMVDGAVIENAAWSYEQTLEDARAIDGMIAFSPGIANLPDIAGLTRRPDAPMSGALIDWLIRDAGRITDPAVLVRTVCEKFVENGIAISRATITIWSLHPQIAGVYYLWRAETGAVEVNEASHETILSNDAYINSPIRHVTAGLGGVRQPLAVDKAEFSFPIMDELKQAGATDYVAMPLQFSDGQINVLTMTCDHPKGFATANLGLVYEVSAIISRLFEALTLRSNTAALLGTYLGESTGARVLGGEFKRGDGQDIDAAILFCDLRGSTSLETRLGRDTYLALLNAFFEATVGEIQTEGGEVLKFIGDAVLAIFPDEGGSSQSCAHAVKAALAIVETLKETEVPGAGIVADCAIGIAHGRVTYGNIGSPDRLDFTVIGAPANVAARLSDLCKTVADPVLVTETVAQACGDGVKSLGKHDLHNVEQPVDVFAPRPIVPASP